MKVVTQLQTTIQQALNDLELPFVGEIHIEHPADINHGDYATNVALVLGGEMKENPRDLAQQIADQIKINLATDKSFISKIEIAGPGFINFTLSDVFLVAEMGPIIQNKATPPDSKNKGKKAVIEYMQPNTNKPLHIGHLRNAILGKAVINLLKANGWEVAKATINNDRGLHIIKSMWGYLSSQGKDDWKKLIHDWQNEPKKWPSPEEMKEERLKKPDYFVGHWYVMADKAAENEAVSQQWQEMLLAWEDQGSPDHQAVRVLWEQMNKWFYQGYEVSAQKIGFDFDEGYISYESEIYEAGRKIILEGLERGIFTQLENGAVQAKLEAFGLPDKVLLRGDGTGIYMTFDIELTRQRVALGADKLVWVVGNDQALYFRQLFAISELLGFGKKEDFHHFAYGMVRLPEGKMSSRKGLVVYADDIVDLAQEKALEIIKEKGIISNLPEDEVIRVAKIVGLGAVKWSMLSMDALSDVKFDVEKSVSFTGSSCPYIQYSYTRCKSILEKVKNLSSAKPFDILNLSLMEGKLQITPSERDLLRNLYTYCEVVEKAALEYAPHHLTTYLFGLAQSLNKFYGVSKVIGSEPEVLQLRLALVIATAQILKKGLGILGIEAVEKM